MKLLKPYYTIHPDSWLLTSDLHIVKAQQEARDSTTIDSREQIRQWILRELIESYHYPDSWLGTRIIPAPSEGIRYPVEKLFGCYVLTVTDEPFIVISIEAPGNAELAEENLKSRLLHEQRIGMGMSTDGTEKGTKFIRRRFDRDKCEYITDLEPYSLRRSFFSQQPCLFETDQTTSSTAQIRPLMPLSERAENLFFEAHSHIRDIDGMHADEALDELCKVLYAKLYDEEMKSRDGFYRIQRGLYGSDEETATMTRVVYEEASEYDIRVFALKIPGYQRSRGVFNAPIRLSSSALAKVVETFQNYSITSSATDVKGRAFQNVLVPSVRSGMGQYFTPYPIVKFMTKIANPTISDLILDPFCGSAHFLSSCLQLVREQSKSDAIEKYWYEFAFGKLHGIEKSDRMVRIAMTDMRLQGDGHSNIRCTDALLAFSNYPDLQPESFDLILTNPPFGSLLGKAAIARLGQFSLADGRASTPLEILGLERCIQFLRPGGRLGIVLPDGILANRATGYVRDWLETQAKLRAIISLPIETFSPYGANIKTSIIFVRKWRSGEQKEIDYPVFLARVDNVGYDTTGRSLKGSDLDTIAGDIREFLNREGW